MTATRIGMSREVTDQLLIDHLLGERHGLSKTFVYGLLSSPKTAPYRGVECEHGNFLVVCIACRETVLFGFPRGGIDEVCKCVE